MRDIAIVIQGPVHENSLRAIEGYQRFGEVIVSCWEDDPPIDIRGVKVVRSKPGRHCATYNQQNCYLQCTTTLAGIEAAQETSDFVIKARSDTFVGNLEPFVRGMLENPDKYTCSNLHFRPDRTFKFHASDKFVGGRTRDMYETFQKALVRCSMDGLLLQSGIYDYTSDDLDGVCPYPWWMPGMPSPTTPDMEPIIGAPCELPWGYVGVYPEVLISTSWLFAKGIRPDRKCSRDQMYENFHVIKMEDCLPYLNKLGWQHPEHNWLEIHDIRNI